MFHTPQYLPSILRVILPACLKKYIQSVTKEALILCLGRSGAGMLT